MFQLMTPPDWPHYTPENTVIYAIGDLHGHLEDHNTLYTLLEIEISKAPEKTHIIIYLGDYVDRGPHSKQLLDKLIKLKNSGDSPNHLFLKGNHENGFLGFMENPHAFSNWLDYGGVETAQSYGVTLPAETLTASEMEALQLKLLQTVPSDHYEFLNYLDLYHVFGDYAFVHAGIQPGVPLKDQEENDIWFIREPFLSWPHPHEKCIVHGHTITSEPEIYLNRIGLDTGLHKHGILTCGIFEDNRVSILQVRSENS